MAARISTLGVGLAIGVAVPLAVAVLMMVALDMLLEAAPTHLVVALAELRLALGPLTPLDSYYKLLTVEVSLPGPRVESMLPPPSPLTPPDLALALALVLVLALALALLSPPPPLSLSLPVAAQCTDSSTG